MGAEDPADVEKWFWRNARQPSAERRDGGQRARAPFRVVGDELMAYNFAQDVELPGSKGTTLPFLMYPQAQTAEGRLDSLDPESFKYQNSEENSLDLRSNDERKPNW